MLKVVKSSTFKDLQRENDGLHEKVRDLRCNSDKISEELEKAKDAISEYQSVLEEVRKEKERLKSLFENADQNQVSLIIKDDLVSVVPVIRWKTDIGEKLIQGGLLNDSNVSNTAIQLALMSIAHEALEQIMESFEPEVKGDD